MKKITFLMVTMILVLGGLAACGKTEANTAPTATPQATTASQPQLFDNLGQPITIDRYGQPMKAVRLGPRDRKNTISITNSSLGINLSIKYDWDMYDRLSAFVKNEGLKTIVVQIRITYFNERGELFASESNKEPFFAIKPGESRYGITVIPHPNNDVYKRPNEDWIIGWSIMVKK